MTIRFLGQSGYIIKTEKSEIMIDPYLDEHPEQREAYDDSEVIMRDDVTERERLAEIKKRNNIE